MSPATAPGRVRLGGWRGTVTTLAGWQAGASALLLCLVVAVTGVDLTLKLIGLRGVVGLFEATELVVPAVVFLGVAHAQVTDGHVRVDLLAGRLRGRTRYLAALVSQTVEVVFLAALSAAAWIALSRSWERGELRFGIVSLEVWPSRALLLVGALTWCAAAVTGLSRIRAARVGRT